MALFFDFTVLAMEPPIRPSPTIPIFSTGMLLSFPIICYTSSKIWIVYTNLFLLSIKGVGFALSFNFDFSVVFSNLCPLGGGKFATFSVLSVVPQLVIVIFIPSGMVVFAAFSFFIVASSFSFNHLRPFGEALFCLCRKVPKRHT